MQLASPARIDVAAPAKLLTQSCVEQVALSRAWVLDRLMRHAQVCLGEIPQRLKVRKAHSADVTELEMHQRDASAANRALELLGRELNLFTEKKEVGKPGEFDHMADEELTAFTEAQGEVVRELVTASPWGAGKAASKRFAYKRAMPMSNCSG
jgi:hypothetical protein